MAEVRRYEILRCCRCGAHHDRPDAGCPECMSMDWERIPVVDERDVQPLVEVARNARNLLWVARGKGPAAKAEAVDSGRQILGAALARFDSKEDPTSSTREETNSIRTSSDDSRLQELLEWVEGAEEFTSFSVEARAFRRLADQIRHLQGKGEK